MKNLKLMILTGIILSLSGCAHGLMRGSVAMKVSDTEAHVCIGEGEVKSGDRVTLFRNECTPEGSSGRDGRGGGTCEKRQLGMGTVQEILNDHYSVVKFDSGVKFEEGTFVEVI